MRKEKRVFKPKVVLALIVKDGKFLLIRRKVRLLKLEWAFPGGVIEDDETDEQAVIREAKEEVGLDVKVVKKLLERKHPDTFVEVAYFDCTPKANQTPKNGETYEIAEIAWVPAGEVLNKFTSDVAPEIRKFILSKARC
ncbi:NUDIX hydrolase [Patescibacteria group bacterium]|nr:NUDIX hydrolase [Patescibacteria group bacterium]